MQALKTSGMAGPRCGGVELLTGRISLLKGATDTSSLSNSQQTDDVSETISQRHINMTSMTLHNVTAATDRT